MFRNPRVSSSILGTYMYIHVSQQHFSTQSLQEILLCVHTYHTFVEAGVVCVIILVIVPQVRTEGRGKEKRIN